MSQNNFISNVKLNNFQKHRSRVIKLDPKLTVITGESETGKSCFLRGQFWLMFNRPNTKRIITHGESRCRVIWTLSDGTKITRQRDKKQNIYVIDGKKLKAFKTNVPQPVADALQVTDVNVQKQIQTHFWFLLSPSKVGQELNKIINLDLIDSSLSKIAALVRKTKTEVEICEERLSDARSQVKDLSWVPAALKAYAAIEDVKRRHARIASRLALLRSLKSTLADCREKLKESEGAIVASQKLLDAVHAAQTHSAKLKRLKSLVRERRSLLDKAAEATRSIEKTQSKIQKLTQGRCPICRRKLKS